MRDTVEALTPSFLRRFTRSVTWKEKVRDITPNAMVHPGETLERKEGMSPYSWMDAIIWHCQNP
jgi:hypothetical protein